MSSIDINFKSNSNNPSIEKIVQQGQRLRNAMVETLLSYDPFNKEILNNPNNCLTLNIKSKSSITDQKKCLCDEQNNKKPDFLSNRSKIHKYLQHGGEMSTNEESQALEILRSMSLNSLLRSTSSGLYKGCCDICDEYENRLFCAGPTMSNRLPEPNLTRFKRKDKVRTVRIKQKHDLLQYVDSLRVQVYSLRLNTAGSRKTEDESSPRLTTSKTYCVEYCLPVELKKPTIKTGSRVDSGLQSNKIIRLCSRHERDGSVYFKQRSVHPVRNLSGFDLIGVRLIFKIGWRRVGQRIWQSLGVAETDLSSLVTAQSLSLEQELTILGDGAPVVLGSLKASLQFGCDGLYFGREFVDAMSCSKENTNLSETDSIHRMSDSDQDVAESPQVDNVLKSANRFASKSADKNTRRSVDVIPSVKRIEKSTETNIDVKRVEKSTETINCSNDYVSSDICRDNYLLHALIQVREARISTTNQSDMYLVSHGLSGDDMTVSKSVYRSDYKLIFNLRQLIPVQYNEKLLDRLRDNYVVVEVRQRDRLLGIAKLPVHNLYLAYRNPAIVRLVLAHNSEATVVIDGWEPISDPILGQVLGELRAVVALGTRQQIENLELSRNRTHLAQHQTTEPATSAEHVQETQQELEKTPDTIVTDKTDAFTQSEPTTMNQTKPPGDFLSCFLEQLIELNQRTAKMVETSTNTDSNEVKETTPAVEETPNQPVIRNTSELLDTLQQALSAPDKKLAQEIDNNVYVKTNVTQETKAMPPIDANAYFKAHVVIESALHIPQNGGARRRCRSRRNKPRNTNESLPSTYVTFQPRSDVRCEATPVAAETTSPRWDYRRDVHLPADLLQGHKRLIFRVWRSASSVTARPDPRADTVIGFAALDLAVLLSGLPGVHGWFNIVDFANKCNGQIQIHVTPLETLIRFTASSRSTSSKSVRPTTSLKQSEDTVPAELLSRALKRKFTELDEITQRLKQRLSAVTDADSDDDFIDEFERDLNTVCTEPELPTSIEGSDETLSAVQSIDDEDKTKHEVRITELDKHLAKGKLKIDSLLEKLSLLGTEGEAGSAKVHTSVPALPVPASSVSATSLPISSVAVSSAVPFASRYVSGCSIHEAEERDETMNQDNGILTDIGLDPHDSIDPDLIFNPLLFQQMFTASLDSTPRLVHCTTLSGLVNEAEDSRRAPDGAGI